MPEANDDEPDVSRAHLESVDADCGCVKLWERLSESRNEDPDE